MSGHKNNVNNFPSISIPYQLLILYLFSEISKQFLPVKNILWNNSSIVFFYIFIFIYKHDLLIYLTIICRIKIRHTDYSRCITLIFIIVYTFRTFFGALGELVTPQLLVTSNRRACRRRICVLKKYGSMVGGWWRGCWRPEQILTVISISWNDLMQCLYGEGGYSKNNIRVPLDGFDTSYTSIYTFVLDTIRTRSDALCSIESSKLFLYIYTYTCMKLWKESYK